MSNETISRKRHTQAVVIIHRMGEQRPMGTLRSFASSILPEPDPSEEKFFSRPDPLSESFELRVIQGRSQPRTHFYEYYWADKISDTSYEHVLGGCEPSYSGSPGVCPCSCFRSGSCPGSSSWLSA